MSENEKKDGADTGGHFLSSLGKIRKPGAPREEKPSAPLPPKSVPKPPPPPPDAAMKARMEELERKLGEREPASPSRQQGAAPSGMDAFFQTRIADLERKLFEVQEKALASALELKSREEAQHKATREAEELFKSIKDNQRDVDRERWISERLDKLEALCGGLKGELAKREEEIIRLKEKAAGADLAGERLDKLQGSFSAMKEQISELSAEFKGSIDEKSRSLDAGAALLEHKLRIEMESRLSVMAQRLAPLEAVLNTFKVYFDNPEEFRLKIKAIQDVSSMVTDRISAVEKNIAAISNSLEKNELSSKDAADRLRAMAEELTELSGKTNFMTAKFCMTDRELYELRGKLARVENETKKPT